MAWRHDETFSFAAPRAGTIGAPHATSMGGRGATAPAGDYGVGGVATRCSRARRSIFSPAVMDGYWRNEAATAEAFTTDGSVRTGDLGWVDEAGRLRLSGRRRERYVRGGNNVYPMEVEAVLADHPDVAAVAIVSRPDAVMGEVGVAVVVPRPDGTAPDLSALRAFAADRLAKYKLPDDVVVLTALPLTAGEKIDRRALERLISGS